MHPFHISILACLVAAPVTATPAGSEPSRSTTAPALEREVERIAGSFAASPLWPGFDPLAVPLAVYDGDRTHLYRHPKPPDGFISSGDSTLEAAVYPGRYEAMTANTSAAIGGVGTATVLLDRDYPGRNLTRLAAMAIHEAFHVFQRARHPGWSGNEGDLFSYPAEDPGLLKLRRLESKALERAVTATDPESAAGWARTAIALRAQRYQGLDSTLVVYERRTELNEGIATWVEFRAAGMRDVHFPEREFGPAEVRLRAYATGPALALLLDRFSPDWPGSFEANDGQFLDAALANVLGAGSTPGFTPAETEEAGRIALQDVGELTAQRKRLVTDFEGRAGWRVVVECAEGQPLWPQGFDPLNVQPAGAGRILHTRFLKVGNESGAIEFLDLQSLTEPAGTHPLFHGVRRALATGLPEPRVTETGTEITIAAPGLSGRFTGARVIRGEKEITIRL
jgi:hypothetical protein